MLLLIQSIFNRSVVSGYTDDDRLLSLEQKTLDVSKDDAAVHCGSSASSLVWWSGARGGWPQLLAVSLIEVGNMNHRMSQRMMLPFIVGVLLLPWFGGLVLGEVGHNFSKCPKFFYNETPPVGFNGAEYQPICQRYKNKYRFATLYHRQHRAPLYSAYILSPADGKRPSKRWKYEPQLAFSRAGSEMTPFHSPVDQNVKESQAVPQDYKGSSFTKGHLNPSMHQETKEDREATFTLTNIVPQQKGSNSGPWNQLENEVLSRYKAFCKGPMHVITGAMPYESVERWIKNRVSVPEYMWSAYCCPSYSSDLPESVQPFFPTYAAVGRNDRNSGEEIVPVNVKARASVRGYDVRRMPLNELEGILRARLNTEISLFRGQCK
ncbi:endonuclease domain-containing 1 protein-like [Toxotes jaculatrix]|uniref:endonuclease domain-containing 1 protein-like n=1 Tax=Toxotes jaculatrix TaxID=941984 RepID=UPI001B3A977C|nr:endonuclease domain-containing 1 protein-like [Toxotes jaculatrix]